NQKAKGNKKPSKSSIPPRMDRKKAKKSKDPKNNVSSAPRKGTSNQIAKSIWII
ncbi:hypothetical protein J1N35_014979, partial [Gossypium stocksii]